MIHYFQRVKSAGRGEIKHQGSLPAFRASHPVLGVCSQVHRTALRSLGRHQGCEMCEFRHDPLFLVVLEQKLTKWKHILGIIQAIREEPWMAALPNFQLNRSSGSAAGYHAALPVDFVWKQPRS